MAKYNQLAPRPLKGLRNAPVLNISISLFTQPARVDLLQSLAALIIKIKIFNVA